MRFVLLSILLASSAFPPIQFALRQPPGLALLHLQGGDTDADPSSPAIVTGQPFSAVQYTRTVQIQPDGRRRITAEEHHVLMARNEDGRILMAGAGMAGEHCDLPSLGKLPLCEYWGRVLFDPKAGMMWSWSEGAIADNTQLGIMDLEASQIAEGERLTSALDKPPDAAAEPGTTVQDLGERSFQGVQARGVRTTVTHAGPDGKAATTIHEVWTSTKLRLVLRVVDGDPLGEERVSGLNHISLKPDPKLFQPPEDRVVRRWKGGSQYAAEDIVDLAQWLVK